MYMDNIPIKNHDRDCRVLRSPDNAQNLDIPRCCSTKDVNGIQKTVLRNYAR